MADRHLKSADFLDVEKFPEMIFESTGTAKLDDRRGELRGNLTLLGVNSNLSTVVQGAILIGVVMFGSLLTMRQART